MELFSLRRRSRGERRRHAAGMESSDEGMAALPPRFEGVGEALALGAPSILETCWVAGRDLADAGVSLGESLEGLRSTTQHVRRRDPSFDEMHAVSVAWSESTLGYLHNLSCNDPLTGLSTMAHLRERIADLYRDSHVSARRHALVVTQVGNPAGLDKMASSRRLALLGHAARSVFHGSEAIGQVGRSRIVVVTTRDDVLAPRVSLLRRMVEERADRVWIEGLPGTDASAVNLLDELARG